MFLFVCNIVGLLSCRAITPYLEALCTIPDAFSFVESSGASFTQSIYSLTGIVRFICIPKVCLRLVQGNPAAAQKLAASAEFQSAFLNCFRILEPLPGQLSRLLTLPHSNEDSESSRRFSLTKKLYNVMIAEIIGVATELVTFMDKKDNLEPSFSLVPVDYSNFLANIVVLAADLVAASQALLDASILGDIPIQCFPSTAAHYIERVGFMQFLLYTHCSSSDNGYRDYDAATFRILAPGTWVRPFFLGIESLAKRLKEDKTDLKFIEGHLSICSYFLNIDRIGTSQETIYLEQFSNCAAVLASPAFQTEAKKYLIEYSACIADVFPPLETGDAYCVRARILDIYVYAAMAEATVITAHVSAVRPNWSQLASNFIDLGNAWMGLNEVTYTKEAAALISITIWKRLANIAFVVRNLLEDFCAQDTIGADPDMVCVPIDVAVQLTTAVERLLALAGSCAKFFIPPPAGRPFAKMYTPVRPAIEIASMISNIPRISIFKSEACESMRKKAMEASLGALETATKTASLFSTYLTPDELHLLLRNGDDPVVQFENVSFLNECFSQVLVFHLMILSHFRDVAPSEHGKLFVASGFLTFTQACAMLGCSVQGSWGTTIEILPELLASFDGFILDCLLPSDGWGLACLHSAAEKGPRVLIMSEEYQEASLAMLKSMLETDMPNIDDTDPARLKLRAQALGLRGCGNIKCTTLRPSSKKSFGKLCAGCQSVRFCGAKCQKADWKGNHKGACKQFQAEANP